MNAWKVRAQTTDLGEFQGESISGQTIEGRGLIPVNVLTKIGFATSVFDVTGGDRAPVMSSVESTQEPDTRAFHDVVTAGMVGNDQGFTDWVQIGLVVPDFLVHRLRSQNQSRLMF